MMADLIDRKQLISALESTKVNCPDIFLAAMLTSAIQVVEAQPSVKTTAEVVHGRWEDKPTGRYGQQQSWCSACRKHSGIGGIEKNRHRAYCPNCGAKMEGGGENAAD